MDEKLEKALKALNRFDSQEASGWSSIGQRRQAWPAAKNTLMDTINELLAKAPPKPFRQLYLSGGGPYEHFDGIQITFDFVPTGIAKVTSHSKSVGLERGPTLVFGQSESGRIGVVRYPAESTLPGEQRRGSEGEYIETVEPEAIDRSTVLRIVTEFFDWSCNATLAGSRSAKERRIGFLPLEPGEPG
jgi:hypothetical protein